MYIDKIRNILSVCLPIYLFGFCLASALNSEENTETNARLRNDFLVWITTQSLEEAQATIAQYEQEYRDNLYLYTQVMITKFDDFAQGIKKRDISRQLAKLEERWSAYAEQQQPSSADYTMWALLKGTRIRYLSLFALIREAQLMQKYYEKAIALDENNALAHIGLGVTLMLAPKIGGGNLEKAVVLLKQGLDLAVYEYDDYGAKLWLSQAYFKMKEQKQYRNAWEQAAAVFGMSALLQRVQEKNQKGKIMGE